MTIVKQALRDKETEIANDKERDKTNFDNAFIETNIDKKLRNPNLTTEQRKLFFSGENASNIFIQYAAQIQDPKNIQWQIQNQRQRNNINIRPRFIPTPPLTRPYDPKRDDDIIYKGQTPPKRILDLKPGKQDAQYFAHLRKSLGMKKIWQKSLLQQSGPQCKVDTL